MRCRTMMIALGPIVLAAGRQAEPPGPEDTASVLNVRRYGPSAVRPVVGGVGCRRVRSLGSWTDL